MLGIDCSGGTASAGNEMSLSVFLTLVHSWWRSTEAVQSMVWYVFGNKNAQYMYAGTPSDAKTSNPREKTRFKKCGLHKADPLFRATVSLFAHRVTGLGPLPFF